MNDIEVMAWIADDAGEFARLLGEARGPDEVPTCPGWCASDLLDHLVPLFATWFPANVTTSPDVHDRAEIVAQFPKPSGDYLTDVALFEESVRAFLQTCEHVDLDEPRWAFGAIEPARFWLRRAATELTVHLTDAASISLGRSSTSAQRTSEAVDEILTGLWPKLAWSRPNLGGVPAPTVPSEPAGLRASDTGRGWTLNCSSDGAPVAVEELETAISTVGIASSADLLAWLSGRPMLHRLHVEGDESLLDRWNLLERD